MHGSSGGLYASVWRFVDCGLRFPSTSQYCQSFRGVGSPEYLLTKGCDLYVWSSATRVTVQGRDRPSGNHAPIRRECLLPATSCRRRRPAAVVRVRMWPPNRQRLPWLRSGSSTTWCTDDIFRPRSGDRAGWLKEGSQCSKLDSGGRWIRLTRMGRVGVTRLVDDFDGSATEISGFGPANNNRTRRVRDS